MKIINIKRSILMLNISYFPSIMLMSKDIFRKVEYLLFYVQSVLIKKNYQIFKIESIPVYAWYGGNSLLPF